MSIAKPQILLGLNETSGTTVTNSGTLGNVTVHTTEGSRNSVENTDWAWHNNADPALGYWQSQDGDNQGSDMAFIILTGLTMPTAQQSMWAAIKFRLSSFDTVTNTGMLKGGSSGGSNADGGSYFRAGPPAGGGNFDLACGVRTSGGFDFTHTYSALTFGTDYKVVVAFDNTTPTACFGKFLLDAGSVLTGSTANPNDVFLANPGWLGRTSDFDNYRGVTALFYYFMEGRGTLLSNADMAAINSNPNAVTGWPGAPAGGFLSRNYWWGNQ